MGSRNWEIDLWDVGFWAFGGLWHDGMQYGGGFAWYIRGIRHWTPGDRGADTSKVAITPDTTRTAMSKSPSVTMVTMASHMTGEKPQNPTGVPDAVIGCDLEESSLVRTRDRFEFDEDEFPDLPVAPGASYEEEVVDEHWPSADQDGIVSIFGGNGAYQRLSLGFAMMAYFSLAVHYFVDTWDMVCSRQWLRPFTRFAFVAGGLIIWVLPFLVDRTGRRPLILAGVVASSMCSFAVYGAYSLVLFILSRFLLGLCLAVLYVTSLLLMFEIVSSEYLALYALLSQLGISSGQLFVAMFNQRRLSWRACATMCLPALVVMRRRLPGGE
ncbi:hypothetical protein MTO96_030413 [Rhipicephalus appendiculatus]